MKFFTHKDVYTRVRAPAFFVPIFTVLHLSVLFPVAARRRAARLPRELVHA